ncbi:MAG: uroporphyrinogen decarboxylase [Chloroflexi bacterium]|nr:uroporphyrinogen decarboxylase [Chloroflexota bacterium]
MAESMSHRERVMAALAGAEVDRPPVSMWRHFYDQETTGPGLVEAMLAFQQRHDWDFLKLNPRAQYHVEDWGVRHHYPADPQQAPALVEAAVKSPEDWGRLRPLEVHAGALGEQLQALREVTGALGGAVPVLMTVFTPLSIAARLVDSEATMQAHLREHPTQVRGALELITESYTAFAEACLEAGADGLFFATTSWASQVLLSEEEYQRFGRPYDLRALHAARQAPFNVLHVCRSQNMLRALLDYPVHAFNWDACDATNPGLAEARTLTGKALIGGIDQRTLHRNTPQEAAAQAGQALAQAGRRGFMLGPGCTVSPRTSPQHLEALKAAV